MIDTETATEQQLDIPICDDDLWHRVKRTAELENVVEGKPILTLCGLRFPSVQEMVRKGRSKREHKSCARCHTVYVYILGGSPR